MASPFGIFRKHGAALTVFLTGLCLFAFVLQDSLFSNASGAKNLPIFLAVLGCGLIGWILGRSTGQSGLYAVGLGVVGLVVALLIPRLLPGNAPIMTSVGNLDAAESAQLSRERQVLNRFLGEMYQEAYGFRAQSMQGSLFTIYNGAGAEADRRDTAMFFVANHEAGKMGIEVSDDAAVKYLKEQFGDALDKRTFDRVARDLNISEIELIEFLKYHLKARMYLNLMQPVTNVSPQQVWEFYKRVAVTQSVEVAGVPVQAFVDEKAVVPEGELITLFEQFKNRYPQGQLDPVLGWVVSPEQLSAEPAFGMPPRIQLAYLEASFAEFRGEVPEVTAEDIKEYYEANLEKYPGKRTSAERARAASRRIGVAVAEESPKRIASSGPAMAEPPKYQPLVEVSELIRQTLEQNVEDAANAAARVKMDATINAAQSKMRELADAYEIRSTPSAENSQAISKKLEEYANANGLRYVVTDPLTPAKMGDEELFPVAFAVEPNVTKLPDGEVRVSARDGAPVAMARLFSDPVELVYLPVQGVESEVRRLEFGDIRDVRRMLKPGGNRYVYWKILHDQYRAPEFEEVREEVAAAFKLAKAREAAKSRAEELAGQVRDSEGKSLQPLNGESITGKDSSALLNVKTTDNFSWMISYQSFQMNPRTRQNGLQRGPLQITEIPPISVPGEDQMNKGPSPLPKAGEEFMKIVFTELNPGDIGVAANGDESVYYVVRVVSRKPGTPEEMQQLREAFLRPDTQNQDEIFRIQAASAMAQQVQRQLNEAWLRGLEKQFDIRVAVSENPEEAR